MGYAEKVLTREDLKKRFEYDEKEDALFIPEGVTDIIPEGTTVIGMSAFKNAIMPWFLLMKLLYYWFLPMSYFMRFTVIWQK